ncbi:XRE family transcriptional regulator [Bordetella avium]|nr:LexA family transcriptional regulator [Bordetella avium]UOK17244.1 repressor protein [Bordetella phage vB_BaM-IFTN4]UOK17319.1 repressor protein [Bordetella phage vB_BaM-IFTN5]UOK17523.1 repressor protein [Bordetella phage vB_BaM-IFTN8]
MKKRSINDILAANLSRLMDKHGHKQASLAKLSGIGQTTISLYLNPDRRQPSKSGKLPSAKLSEVEVLAEVLGVSPWELLTPHDHAQPNSAAADSHAQAPKRGTPIDMDAVADEFPMRIPGLPPGPSKIKEPAPPYVTPRLSLAQATTVNVVAAERHADNDEWESVPEMADVRLAAGEGIENHAEEMTGYVYFRRSFLRSVGADGQRGRMVYAKGDSMEPVIRDGAALLVVPDLGLTLHDLAAGGVYAINYDGKMLVKTVAKDRLTGRWVARSFNARHPDIPLEDGASVRVLGRVVWAGAQLGEDEQGQWVRR